MRTPYLSLLALAVVLAGCAPRAGGSAAPPRNFISAEEIAGATAADLYLAVQTLRPGWLRRQGPQSISYDSQIWVYMDGMKLGGVDQLRQITVSGVESLQFLPGIEASQRWGLDHGHGAIVITSRR